MHIIKLYIAQLKGNFYIYSYMYIVYFCRVIVVCSAICIASVSNVLLSLSSSVVPLLSQWGVEQFDGSGDEGVIHPVGPAHRKMPSLAGQTFQPSLILWQQLLCYHVCVEMCLLWHDVICHVDNNIQKHIHFVLSIHNIHVWHFYFLFRIDILRFIHKF